MKYNTLPPGFISYIKSGFSDFYDLNPAGSTRSIDLSNNPIIFIHKIDRPWR